MADYNIGTSRIVLVLVRLYKLSVYSPTCLYASLIDINPLAYVGSVVNIFCFPVLNTNDLNMSVSSFLFHLFSFINMCESLTKEYVFIIGYG